MLDRRYTHESAGRVSGLAAYAGSARWTRATPSQPITTAALCFVGAGIILHAGIGSAGHSPARPSRRTHDFPGTIQPGRAQAGCRYQRWRPAVRRLVAAINDGDREAFLALLTPDATLTDDGNLRSLHDWIDREIFSAHGHLTVEQEQEDGLYLLARYRNDTWGEMSTF